MNTPQVNKMHWDKLICDKRLGLEDYQDAKEGIRSDFQRDYDRLIFSSPFRRLQNKTQVFPLPGSIFVHNRLTHSLEVSSVGKSLAREVAQELRKKYAAEAWCHKLNEIGEIVAAACLAHDLGNPPFGHSGEKTISAYFTEGEGKQLKSTLSDEQWADLTHFEGNANSFRWLVHQFKGRRPGGFAMTYSMLMSIVKYPFSSTNANAEGKFGFFTTEHHTYKKVATELGIIQKAEGIYARHPLVFLVEAADDICYEVMDIEDAHKLKILNHDETISLMLSYFDEERTQHILEVMDTVADPNEKVAYLRSCIIGLLVKQCAATFVEHEEEILRGEFQDALIKHIEPRAKEAYQQCAEVAFNKIYCAASVVDVDLAGSKIINLLLQELLDAVLHPNRNYSKLLLTKFPEQYETDAPSQFDKVMSVIDHISGMTDVYALNLYRTISGMSLPAV